MCLCVQAEPFIYFKSSTEKYFKDQFLIYFIDFFLHTHLRKIMM